MPGFPNFFTVFGPYGYVGSSYFALIETQTHHIVRCLKRAHRRSASRVEVTQEANDRYFAEMMRKRHRQIFWQDSCRLANSYYFDKNGDVPLRPASTIEAYWRSRRFPLDDYQLQRLAPKLRAASFGAMLSRSARASVPFDIRRRLRPGWRDQSSQPSRCPQTG